MKDFFTWIFSQSNNFIVNVSGFILLIAFFAAGIGALWVFIQTLILLITYPLYSFMVAGIAIVMFVMFVMFGIYAYDKYAKSTKGK